MKYLDLITRDEDQVKEDEAKATADLAKNSAERDIINIKHEIAKLTNQIEDMKASEDFDLRALVEKRQEKKILEKDLAEAENLVDELF